LNLPTSVQRGLAVAIISVVLYLAIVVLTSPSLKPVSAVVLALTLNWWLIGGVSAGTGVQAFLLTYAKSKSCPVRHKAATVSTSGIFSTLSSFLSFLSLIPIGCCGTWIYVLSFLPGVLGAGASGFLLGNSFKLEIGGLILMFSSVFYTYLSVRKRFTSREGLLVESSGGLG